MTSGSLQQPAGAGPRVAGRERTPSDAVLSRVLVAAVAVGYLGPLVVESYLVPKGFRPITDAPPPPDPSVELTTLLCNALVLLVCAGVVVLRVRHLRRLVAPVALLLLAWLVAVAGLLAGDGTVARGVVLFPAICAAVALLRPGAAMVRALGWAVVGLVLVSIGMALLTPEAGLYVQEASRLDEKFVWDHGMLVGPFRTGNNLGLVLAAGLPFALALRPRWLQVGATLLTVVALAWTFSRTSLLAGVAGLGVWAVLTLLPRWRGAGARLPRLRGVVAAGAIAVLGLAVLALPFVTASPTAFNNRGGFWHQGVDAWLERPLLGWGADYYLQLARSADNLGGFAYHAHNQAMQLLVTGGVVLLALVASAVVLAAVSAVRRAAAGEAWPAVFLVTVLVSATLEVPLGIVDRGMFYPAVLVPLALLLAGGRDPRPARTDREVPLPA